MRMLQRGAAPECLAEYDFREHKWDKLSKNRQHRMDIWQCIDAMQDGRCAYCEMSTPPEARHIEHLHPRAAHPSRTFDWNNIYGSCNRDDSCGTHKDRKGKPYNPNDIIRPDIENPGAFFQYGIDGKIGPKHGLSDDALLKAKETIRVFNLDGILTAIRRAHIKPHIETMENFNKFLEEYTEDEVFLLFDEELNAISELEFSSIITSIVTGS